MTETSTIQGKINRLVPALVTGFASGHAVTSWICVYLRYLRFLRPDTV